MLESLLLLVFLLSLMALLVMRPLLMLVNLLALDYSTKYYWRTNLLKDMPVAGVAWLHNAAGSKASNYRNIYTTLTKLCSG
jgi:hypothetical protein